MSCQLPKKVISKKMPYSRLDIYYRRLILTKLFTSGWGDPIKINKLLKFRKLVSVRNSCYNLVHPEHPIEILDEHTSADHYMAHGRFKSPFGIHLPDVVPDALKDAHFEIVLPKVWSMYPYKPICIHLAGTGDHFYWKRRCFMANPLLKSGIGSIILENPFYGKRKPSAQIRSCLFNVSDIFVMGGCLILECIALLNWCERLGYGPLGVTGLSMGGHMASLAATSWPKPLVAVPCLSWSTASSVFTEGVMSEAINWKLLQKQFSSDYRFSQILSKSCKIVDTPVSINQLADFRVKEKEAVLFMRALMDEFTHLWNFDVPVDTSLVIAITASMDAYVPKQGLSPLQDIWPGATVHYLECGHVSAYLTQMNMFRNSIVEGFHKAIDKLPPPSQREDVIVPV